MDILQQCQKWNEEDEYRKIVNALEDIPPEERTPDTDMELARAYNNLADLDDPNGAGMLRRAIALLRPLEEFFAEDHRWNFRMGYAYYYLDQEGRALPYFEKALEALPGDEDTQRFIDDCKKRISLPQFQKCFRERTEDWWRDFARIEGELRRRMDEDQGRTQGEEIVGQMGEALDRVFGDVSFEMGFNGEKHELILTPEGDRVKLFELVYFRKQAPENVLEHWNILVGRQSNPNMAMQTDDGWKVSGEDVQIWLEEGDEGRFAIFAYCEKLLEPLREEEGRVWWMLTTLTDQMLGEIPHMRYIDSFEVLDQPRAEPSILLSKLPEELRARGLDLSADPEAYLDTYSSYKMDPNEDPKADWRLDTIAGSSSCLDLLNCYLHADNRFMDDLQADGAVGGFLCYPLAGLQEEEGSQKIFDLRDRLEEKLTEGEGEKAVTLIGGATGIYCGYLDFIAWDLRSVLRTADEFFANSDIPWACFQSFRREANPILLKK